MRFYHGEKKEKQYFEGWYVKHQCGNHTIAFIPAFHIGEDGRKFASIQVITEEKAEYFEFPITEFKADKRHFLIKIGENIFTEKGLYVNLEKEGFQVKGVIKYGHFHPLVYNIMGPFSLIPKMECKHGVISLFHSLSGVLQINGTKIDFKNGVGYIETDFGKSFPSSYLWSQCSEQDHNNVSIIASAADIPFAGYHFKGCICSVFDQGKEYRLATYLGAKVIYGKKGMLIKQGDKTLKIQLLKEKPFSLKAPVHGNMSRRVEESSACEVKYEFYKKEKQLFQFVCKNAGYEYGTV